jgi:hypothetical protein
MQLQGHIDTVVSGGKCQVPFGVFPSLKVTYKPANKFHRETGFLSKSSNLVNKQKIVVKNNGQKSILLTIMEPIPKATDEKIKVKFFLEFKNMHSSFNFYLFYRFPFPSSPQPLLTKPIRNITPLW